MKIGIFGGTFDPVHRGHLWLAKKALKKFSLDRIYFVPARRSPFKKESPCASAQARIQMLRLALEGHPAFKISNCEIKRKAPSFTIHTVKFFRRHFPRADLFLILGKDALKHFRRWRDWRSITKECRLAAQKRLRDISSSDIRERLAHGKSAAKDVPTPVARYMAGKRLYRK